MYGILAKYPIGKLFARILKMTPWLLLFFAFQVLLFKVAPDDKILWEWNFIKLTQVKLLLGIKMFLHFVGAMVSISVFAYTIEETELVEGMKFILYPLEKLKFNQYDFSKLIFD